MVSILEAGEFLSNQLMFKNWQDVLQEDKLKYLKLLVPYFANNNYFQNITMSSVTAEERKFPDEKDIIKAGLNGIGGNCIFNNGFLMLLLKALGFDAYIAAGTFKGEGYGPDNHVICIVRLNPDELYLLDCGMTLPFAEPVPLHNLPHVNRAAGCRYSYRKGENGMYQRMQLDGALFGGRYEDSTAEFLRYDFTLEPKTFEFFREPLTYFFVDPIKSNFLQYPFMFRYFNENEQGEVTDDVQLTGNRKFIHIRGVSILIADDDTKVVKELSSYDDLKETLRKYFPKFDETTLTKSLKCFNENTKDECLRLTPENSY